MKIKKYFKVFRRAVVIFIVAATSFIGYSGVNSINVFADEGRDISNYVNVESLSLTLSDGTDVDVQTGASASSNLEDYVVDAASVDSGVLTLSIQLPSGDTLRNGDYFNVEVLEHSTESTIDLSLPGNTGYVGLYNGSTNIGQWKIEGGNIVGEFNENAVGMSITHPFEIVFVEGSVRAWRIGYDRIGQITIGNKTFYFRIDGQGLHRLADSKWQRGVASNNYIVWAYRVGSSLSNSLLKSNGASGDIVNCYFEDSYEGAIDVSIGTISAFLPAPLTIQDGSDGATFGSTFKVGSFFTKVVQQEGETYNSFRARVIGTPRQYGVYKSSDGLFSVVVNFGRLGADGPSWSNIDENYIDAVVDRVIAYGYYSEEQRSTLVDRMTASFGRNAITHGNVTSFDISVSVSYPLALDERTFSSDATFTYGNAQTLVNGTGRLVGISSSIEVSSFSALLVQADADSSQVVPGGTYKVQLKGRDGEYTDYLANDGGELIRTVNGEGKILFSNLGVGVYRMAQVTSPDGYSKKQSEGYDETDDVIYSEDFTIRADDEEGAIVAIRIKQGSDEEEDVDIVAPDTGAFVNKRGDYVINSFSIALFCLGTIISVVLAYLIYRRVSRKLFYRNSNFMC